MQSNKQTDRQTDRQTDELVYGREFRSVTVNGIFDLHS